MARHALPKYILKRILCLIPVLVGILLILFVLSELTPADAADAIPGLTDAQRDAYREQLGLNDPVLVRFFRYLVGAFTGNLGNSYKSGQPVFGEVLQRIPLSLFFAFGSTLLGILIGVPLGVLSALKEYSLIDNILIVFSMLFLSMPLFCVGLFMIYFFSVLLGVLPAFGIESWKGYIMPMAIMVLAGMASYIRVSRTTMLEAMRQDYVMTARAKGQKESVVVFKHMLRNALIPIVSQVGNDIGHNVGGALVLETVFGVPGIGKYIADAIGDRNYPAVLGGVFILAAMVSLINLIVDVSYTFVDPRLKTSIVMATISTKRKKGSA